MFKGNLVYISNVILRSCPKWDGILLKLGQFKSVIQYLPHDKILLTYITGIYQRYVLWLHLSFSISGWMWCLKTRIVNVSTKFIHERNNKLLSSRWGQNDLVYYIYFEVLHRKHVEITETLIWIVDVASAKWIKVTQTLQNEFIWLCAKIRILKRAII